MAQLLDKAKIFLVDKVAHIKKPEADLADVDVKDVNTDSATFNSEVTISNPYSHDLPIGAISYTLKSSGRVIASGKMLDPGSIRAEETTPMNIPVKVPYSVLKSLMRDVGKDWDIDYELDVGLTMDIPVLGEFTLPLNKKGEVKLPTLSDIF